MNYSKTVRDAPLTGNPLIRQIRNGIKNVVLSPKDLTSTDGTTQWLAFDEERAEDDLVNIHFLVDMQSEPISWQEGDDNVDRACVGFDVIVKGCSFDEGSETYTWTGNKEFALKSDSEIINVLTFYKEEPMNTTDFETVLASGLEQGDDESLSVTCSCNVVNNTPRTDIIAALEFMLNNQSGRAA